LVLAAGEEDQGAEVGGHGEGLRLSELLRLRVKDVDLERLQSAVRAGKGNKDRQTMISRSLAAQVKEHRERLRGLHEKYRDAGRRICWKTAPASATCRTCWAMRTSRRRRSICTSPSKRALEFAVRWIDDARATSGA